MKDHPNLCSSLATIFFTTSRPCSEKSWNGPENANLEVGETENAEVIADLDPVLSVTLGAVT